VGIVDDLLANPGLYLGVDQAGEGRSRGAARMVVAPLPGLSGITLEYEVLDPATPDRLRGHLEHTIVARTHDGGVVMVIGHLHAGSVAVLRETDPGVFELGSEGSPFPMKVIVSVPGPGRIHHSWWYGAPGEDPVERDVADLTLAG
jgi:hypothetical protein